MDHQAITVTVQADFPDELIDRIADRVLERVKPLLPKTSTQDADTIFDVKGLADYLKSTEEWVREQARTGKVPCFKSGKSWKFRKKDIEKCFPSRSTTSVRGGR
jgi:hypothetical protein